MDKPFGLTLFVIESSLKAKENSLFWSLGNLQSNPLNFCSYSQAHSINDPRNRENSLQIPAKQGIPLGDRFGSDCAHHQILCRFDYALFCFARAPVLITV